MTPLSAAEERLEGKRDRQDSSRSCDERTAGSRAHHSALTRQ